MTRLRFVIVSLSSAIACAAPGRQISIRDVATEIRVEIKDIHQALGEITPQDENVAEVCFRVGNLYQSARHELEEVAADRKDLSGTEKQLVEALIKDAKSLTTFCGDKEKQKQDPGYEQVSQGDENDLRRELRNMDERAGRLIAP